MRYDMEYYLEKKLRAENTYWDIKPTKKSKLIIQFRKYNPKKNIHNP